MVGPAPSQSSVTAADGNRTIASTAAKALPVDAAARTSAPHQGASGGAGTSTQAAATSGTATSAATAARAISAEALSTLLQTLGKALPGTADAGGRAGGQGRAGQLPVTVILPPTTGAPSESPAIVAQGTLPATAGAPSGTSGASVTATLPLPAGAKPLPAGTPLLVAAEADGAGPRLTVTVTGPAPQSAQSVRSDAARQMPLPPLLADLAALTGTSGSTRTSGPSILSPTAQQKLPEALRGPVVQLLGQTLSAGALSADGLRTAFEAPTALPSPAPQAGGGAAAAATRGGDLTSALAALVRALGLQAGQSAGAGQASASTGAPGSATAGSLPASSPPSSHSGAPTPGASATPQPTDPTSPSRVPSAIMPDAAPDLGDPSQLAALKTKAEGALARANLLQALNAGPEANAALRADGGTSLRWDVPLFIGQEAALLGLVVEREPQPSGANSDTQPVSWRFKFAFESRTYGGIEGLVALHRPPGAPSLEDGGDASLDIAVWAQDETVRGKLAKTRETLSSELRLLGFTIDSLSVGSEPIRSGSTLGAGEGSGGTPHGEAQGDHHLVDVQS